MVTWNVVYNTTTEYIHVTDEPPEYSDAGIGAFDFGVIDVTADAVQSYLLNKQLVVVQNIDLIPQYEMDLRAWNAKQRRDILNGGPSPEPPDVPPARFPYGIISDDDVTVHGDLTVTGTIHGSGDGPAGVPTFIQASAPTVQHGLPYAWWDTSGGNLTLWIEDAT